MKSIGIIPARYASTRFPGKPLALIQGVPMIQRVYERAAQSELDKVIVATDDERIAATVQSFGGHVYMTSPSHPNGTERCIEVFNNQAIDYDFMINIQGDEPFVQPAQLNAMLHAFRASPSTFSVLSLMKKITRIEDILSPNVVKVVTGVAYKNTYPALYFSRNAVPYMRDARPQEWLEKHNYFKHLGLYGFSKNFIKEQHPALQTTDIEQVESLEQLRWLAHQIPVHMLETAFEAPSIDTPLDLEHAEQWLKRQKSV
jgi:3-deoxy-manno-octulosonate cytidylyltransferase (CMP-KDO synthetase)